MTRSHSLTIIKLLLEIGELHTIIKTEQMSLHSTKIEGSTLSKKQTKHEYEVNKRVRSSKDSWKSTYPWVKYVETESDNIYICSICVEYPVITDQTSKLITGVQT